MIQKITISCKIKPKLSALWTIFWKLPSGFQTVWNKLKITDLNLKIDDDRPQVTKKEKKKKKKVKKTGLSFADDDPSEETENFKLKKSSR